jgi:uncharacterized membrane-anchored protein
MQRISWARKVQATKLLHLMDPAARLCCELRLVHSLAPLVYTGLFLFALPKNGDGAENPPSSSPLDDPVIKEYFLVVSAKPSLYRRSDEVILGQEIARLQVPRGFIFLEEYGTKIVTSGIHDLPSSLYLTNSPLGMLYPDTVDRNNPQGWGVIISYDKTTRVSDETVSNSDGLLQSMEKEAHAANSGRVKDGLKAIRTLRWAVPPQYDSSKHRLFWIIEVHYEGDPQVDYVCAARILGGTGVLRLDAANVAGRLALLKEEMPVLMNAIEILPGNRYDDYKADLIPKTSTSELIRSSLDTEVYVIKENEERTQKWNAAVSSLLHRPKGLLLLVIAVIWLGRLIFRRVQRN